jgi:hypothetical protein
LFLIILGKPSNTMFPISDRVHIFMGDPSQHWATLMFMKIKLVNNEKNNFSPEWNMIIWQFLTDNCIQGFFCQKINFWPRKWTLWPKLSTKTKKQYFFFRVIINSFVPNFFGKTVKYHVPNKRLHSHFFLVCPFNSGPLWYKWEKIGYNWKKNFSKEWNMIIWQFLTEIFI